MVEGAAAPPPVYEAPIQCHSAGTKVCLKPQASSLKQSGDYCDDWIATTTITITITTATRVCRLAGSTFWGKGRKRLIWSYPRVFHWWAGGR